MSVKFVALVSSKFEFVARNKMKRASWKHCFVAALATMVLTVNRVVALSASRFGKVGATITSKNTKTGEDLMP